MSVWLMRLSHVWCALPASLQGIGGTAIPQAGASSSTPVRNSAAMQSGTEGQRAHVSMWHMRIRSELYGQTTEAGPAIGTRIPVLYYTTKCTGIQGFQVVHWFEVLQQCGTGQRDREVLSVYAAQACSREVFVYINRAVLCVVC